MPSGMGGVPHERGDLPVYVRNELIRRGRKIPARSLGMLDRSRSWQSGVTGRHALRASWHGAGDYLDDVRGSGEHASESGEACAGKCSHWLTGRKSLAALPPICSKRT